MFKKTFCFRIHGLVGIERCSLRKKLTTSGRMCRALRPPGERIERWFSRKVQLSGTIQNKRSKGRKWRALKRRDGLSQFMIRRGVGTQDEQLALPLNFAGDFKRLGNQVEHLPVYRPAIGGDQQQINRRAVL